MRRQREAGRQAAYTLEQMVEQYVAECLSKQKQGGEGARLLRRELLPKFVGRAATSIMRRELQDEVIRPIVLQAPRMATYLLSRTREFETLGLVMDEDGWLTVTARGRFVIRSIPVGFDRYPRRDREARRYSRVIKIKFASCSISLPAP